MANKIINKIEKFEYSSFMIGTIIDPEISEREDIIRSEFKIRGGEPIKSEITKETSKFIARKKGKRISLRKPELNILINTLIDNIEISSKSIFVMGRYIKTIRGINQKKQRCKECSGEGCKICKFSGSMKIPSIENEIQKFLKKKFNAINIKISWVGSEDQNSIVKNKGRPFFAEVISPVRRKVLIREKKMNNGIVIKSVEILQKKPIINYGFIMKTRVNFVCNCKDSTRLKKLERVFTERNISIYSKNKRKYFVRKVLSIKLKKINGKQVVADVICEGGINIKKLISGENDEVDPNFRKVMRIKCIPEKKAPFDIHYVKIHKLNKKDLSNLDRIQKKTQSLNIYINQVGRNKR